MNLFWDIFLGGLALGFAAFFVLVGALAGWLLWALVRGWLGARE